MQTSQEAEAIRKGTHVYENGQYKAVPYIHQDYPKYKYHPKPDLRNKKAFTAIVVKDEAEEAKLGSGWFDTPAAFGIISCPSVEQVEEQFLKELAAEEAKLEAPKGKK